MTSSGLFNYRDNIGIWYFNEFLSKIKLNFTSRENVIFKNVNSFCFSNENLYVSGKYFRMINLINLTEKIIVDKNVGTLTFSNDHIISNGILSRIFDKDGNLIDFSRNKIVGVIKPNNKPVFKYKNTIEVDGFSLTFETEILSCAVHSFILITTVLPSEEEGVRYEAYTSSLDLMFRKDLDKVVTFTMINDFICFNDSVYSCEIPLKPRKIFKFDKEIIGISPNQNNILLDEQEIFSLDETVYKTFKDDPLYYISGPVEFIFVKLKKPLQKFYLFSDHHFSNEGLCSGLSLMDNVEALVKTRPEEEFNVFVEDELTAYDFKRHSFPLPKFIDRTRQCYKDIFVKRKLPNCIENVTYHWTDIRSEWDMKNHWTTIGMQKFKKYSIKSGQFLDKMVNFFMSLDVEKLSDQEVKFKRSLTELRSRKKEYALALKAISENLYETDIFTNQYVYASMMDLNTINRIFRYPLKNVIYFAGDYHITSLVKYLELLKGEIQVFSDDISSRCIKVDIGIDKL
jgi:hypothetical protein